MSPPDWIRLVEAGYALEPEPDAWRREVLAGTAPIFGQEEGLVLYEARVDAERVEIEQVEVAGPTDSRARALAVVDAGPPEAIDRVYRSGAVVGSLSELIFDHAPAAHRPFLESAGDGIRDGISVVGRVGAGRLVVIVAARLRRSRTTAAERVRWHRAMTHVCAGLRLRRRLSAGDDAPQPRAVLDPDGRLHDASPDARSCATRERLRDAARHIERARSRAGRRDPDAALEGWRGLVDGRFSLVDRFESDGKRFVVAFANDPDVPDPRGLSRRELQVAERVGQGRSTKEVAYELGLSESAVSMAVGRARRKLGLGSRTELAAFFAPGGLRGRLVEGTIAGERALVGSLPAFDPERMAGLSPAERDVAAALLAGSTSAHIAAQRGTSERTIANQIASIFDKLGIHSRVELAARLATDGLSSGRGCAPPARGRDPGVAPSPS